LDNRVVSGSRLGTPPQRSGCRASIAIPAHVSTLQEGHAVIHDAGDDGEDDQASHDQRHVEDVLAIDDEVAETGLARQELADDRAAADARGRRQG
jgi:hypothetical protein